MKKFLLLLLLFLLAYYIIKAVSRLFKVFVQKPENINDNKNDSNFGRFDDTSRQNSVRRKRFEKDEGEYIDYEEVK